MKLRNIILKNLFSDISSKINLKINVKTIDNYLTTFLSYGNFIDYKFYKSEYFHDYPVHEDLPKYHCYKNNKKICSICSYYKSIYINDYSFIFKRNKLIAIRTHNFYLEIKDDYEIRHFYTDEVNKDDNTNLVYYTIGNILININI